MSDLSLTEAECLIIMSRLAPKIMDGDAPMGAERLFRKIAAYHLGRCIDMSADNVLRVFELYQAAGMVSKEEHARAERAVGVHRG